MRFENSDDYNIIDSKKVTMPMGGNELNINLLKFLSCA